MSTDIINGGMALIGAGFLFQNVRAIWKDKSYRGVRMTPTVFFITWGMWNLYYFYSIGQMYSLIGFSVIAVIDVMWICLMFKYRRN